MSRHSSRADDVPTTVEDCQPLFVVGCPRSGTTMISELLEQTPWGAPFETHFIPRYAPRGEADEARLRDSPARRQALLRRIIRERAVQQWAIDWPLERMADETDGVGYAGLVDRVCRTITRTRHDARSWSDKTPHYILHLDTLRRLYPAAWYIHVIRDGRDVALSLLKKPWGPGNIAACAEYWADCSRVTSSIQALISAGRMVQIRYEDLLTDPGESLSRLLDWLGQPSTVFDRMAGRIERLQRDNHDKWRSEMSAAQIERFERIAGDTLEYYGYARSHEQTGLPWPARALWATHGLSYRLAHLLYMNTVEDFQIRVLGREPFGK